MYLGKVFVFFGLLTKHFGLSDWVIHDSIKLAEYSFFLSEGKLENFHWGEMELIETSETCKFS